MGIGFYSGGKAAGAWLNHPLPPSAEVKERVELYLYPPPRAFMVFYRVNFSFLPGPVFTRGEAAGE
jgi:hypothetical protein